MGAMALTMNFAGQAQLWAQIVLSRGERVFVATDERFELGAPVSLALTSPDLTTALGVTSTVVGHRPATASTPAGVVVTLDAPSVERVEAALKSLTDELGSQRLRAPPRAEHQFAARVLRPSQIDGCSVKSLSATGLILSTPAALMVESEVLIGISLLEHEVRVPATVSWARPELNLVGLRLGQLDPEVRNQLTRAIEADAQTATKTSLPSGYTIVVADDDAAILDFLARVVTTAGHRVVRAERGDVALQLIRHERPQLIFLDVLMPGLDGLEVCSAVRADLSTSRTPVVLLSAMGEQRLAETVREVQANDYLTKPMKIESVRAILSKYL